MESAANMCKGLTHENADKVMDQVPNIVNLLAYQVCKETNIAAVHTNLKRASGLRLMHNLVCSNPQLVSGCLLT